jgi:hypothetical protein
MLVTIFAVLFVSAVVCAIGGMLIERSRRERGETTR